MARVEIASQAWGWLVDSSGNPLPNTAATLKNLDGTNATHWSAVTGGTSSTGALTTGSDGTLPRFVEAGSYNLTSSGVTRRVEAVSGLASVSPLSFGGDPTGASSADTALTNALATGRTVDLGGPENTWKITNRLALASGARLVGHGATVDFSTATKVGATRYGLFIQGSTGTALPLTVNATKGAYTLTISTGDAGTLAVGDWVQVHSNAVYPYGDVTYNVNRGEIKKIRTIAAGVLTFEQGLYDSYATADSASVRKVSFVEDVQIEGIRFVGPNVPDDNSRAVVLQYVNGFAIRDCDFEGADIYNVELSSCIIGSVSGGSIRGVFYDGTVGSIRYAVVLLDSTQWVRVENVHVEQCRHHTVATSRSSGQGFWGCPREVVVDGNVAQNMEAGAGGASWAYEHHGQGDGVIFSNNTADGCYGGFVTRGRNVKFIGNTVRNWEERAIEIHTDTAEAVDITIENNTIKDAAGSSTTRVPIIADLDSVTTIKRVRIADNTIEHTAVGTSAIRLNAAPVSSQSLVVKNNEITAAGYDTATQYQIYTAVAGTLIQGNTITDCRWAINADGASCTVKGNTCRNPTRPATSSSAIIIGQPDCVVRDNDIENFYRGVNVLAAATGVYCKNNSVRNPNSAADAFLVSATLTGAVVIGNDYIDEVQDVASAATVTLPTGNGDLYRITGSTGITSITASYDRRTVTLRFAGTLTVTSGSNLSLAPGNFTSDVAGDSTLTLIYNRASALWREIARAV